MPSTTSNDAFPADVWLLLVARFARMLAFGASSLVLALFLSDLGQTPVQVGRFLTLTLIGDFVLSLILTFVADSIGRRNTLRFGAVSMMVSGLVFASASNVTWLLLAAIFGVISPSGNEIGPFRAVEESILAQLVTKQQRPQMFSWYVITGSFAAALATWLGGWAVKIFSQGSADHQLLAYYRLIFLVYAALGLVKLLLSLFLTEACELQPATTVASTSASQETAANGNAASERDPLLPTQQQPQNENSTPQDSSFNIAQFAHLCVLFAIDSLGSGMVSQTIQSWFLSRKFNADLSSLGSILSAALLVSSLTNIFSARLASILGLVPTMVLTHIPSCVFLAVTPLPTSIQWTTVLIVARAATSSMDQAPRSAFLSAYVPASHRTRVMGLVNTVKTLAQSGGPFLTGFLAQSNRMGWAFHIAGTLKICYDLGLLLAFRHVQ